MSSGNLTDKQVWIFSNGLYGYWWNFLPYNTREYQEQFEECMRNYEALWNTQRYSSQTSEIKGG